MKSTFCVLFYIKNQPNKQGLCPVIVRITIDHVAVCFNTKQNIRFESWDQTTGRVKGTSPQSKLINHTLATIRAQLITKYNEIHIIRQEPITAARLRDIYLGIDKAPTTLLAYFDRFNDKQKKLLNKSIAYSTFKKYILTRARLAYMLGDIYKRDDIPLGQINLQFIMDFELSLRVRFGLSNNSAEKLIRIFKRIVMLAKYNGLIVIDPFTSYKISVEDVSRFYLTKDELNRIINKEFTIGRINRVKDIFLFCCFTGLSYIDVRNLTHDDVETGFDGNMWLKTRRQKTHVPIQVRLFKTPLQIIERYKGKTQNNCLLPTYSNQRMNTYLKEIADCCGITKPITFHTARHTFATTIALANNLPIETLSKVLGHKSIKSTLVYAKITNHKLAEDMEKLAQKIE